MAKYIYPAIFTKEDTFYTVHFPDLDSCYTQGNSLQDAYEMAADVLCLTLYYLEEKKANIPSASEITSIKTEKNEFISLVACDTLKYRQYYDNRAVKKTLTIPYWLNIAAEREGINFSATLKDDLLKQLKQNH